MSKRAARLFSKIKGIYLEYDEEYHCTLLLEIMMRHGRFSHFCTKVLISERTFYNWTYAHPLFAECYEIGKMFAREKWEKEGLMLRSETNPPGVISHKFEHWKMVGWSQFGISKNSRIKLGLNPKSNPSEHYIQLLQQAANGDFTASEIKQLMEAINVGLSLHRSLELQKQIDEIKKDQETIAANNNVHNHGTNKAITENH